MERQIERAHHDLMRSIDALVEHIENIEAERDRLVAEIEKLKDQLKENEK